MGPISDLDNFPTTGDVLGIESGYQSFPDTDFHKQSSDERDCTMKTSLRRMFIVFALTTITAFGADNTLGTWKLNMEKPKYTGAPMPVKSFTTTREASDGGVKVTVTGEQANGTAIDSTYTAKYDGKEVNVTGNSSMT